MSIFLDIINFLNYIYRVTEKFIFYQKFKNYFKIIWGDFIMLNFVICEDNLNILNKLSNLMENIFVKYNYDAKVTLATDNPDNLIDYVCANNIDVVIFIIFSSSSK